MISGVMLSIIASYRLRSVESLETRKKAQNSRKCLQIKGLWPSGHARDDLSVGLEAVYEVSDVLSPVLIQSRGVILCANRTINTPQKINELAILSSLYPSVVVLLNGSSTPASLPPIGLRATLMEDAILSPLLTILGIPNSGNDGSELTVQLRTDVHTDCIHVVCSPSDPILGYDSLVIGLGIASDAKEQSSDEAHGYYYTHSEGSAS